MGSPESGAPSVCEFPAMLQETKHNGGCRMVLLKVPANSQGR
jgi:hypothetical protein